MSAPAPKGRLILISVLVIALGTFILNLTFCGGDSKEGVTSAAGDARREKRQKPPAAPPREQVPGVVDVRVQNPILTLGESPLELSAPNPETPVEAHMSLRIEKAEAELLRMRVSGGQGAFSVAHGSCPAPPDFLAQGAECSLLVRYQPSNWGESLEASVGITVIPHSKRPDGTPINHSPVSTSFTLTGKTPPDPAARATLELPEGELSGTPDGTGLEIDRPGREAPLNINGRRAGITGFRIEGGARALLDVQESPRGCATDGHPGIEEQNAMICRITLRWKPEPKRAGATGTAIVEARTLAGGVAGFGVERKEHVLRFPIRLGNPERILAAPEELRFGSIPAGQTQWREVEFFPGEPAQTLRFELAPSGASAALLRKSADSCKAPCRVQAGVFAPIQMQSEPSQHFGDLKVMGEQGETLLRIKLSGSVLQNQARYQALRNILRRQEVSSLGGRPQGAAPEAQEPPRPPAAPEDYAAHGQIPAGIGPAVDQRRLLLAGSRIRATIEPRVEYLFGIGAPPPHVTAVVDQDVYSGMGRNVIIQRGTRLYGELQTGPPPTGKNHRVTIQWSRAVAPDGSPLQSPDHFVTESQDGTWGLVPEVQLYKGRGFLAQVLRLVTRGASAALQVQLEKYREKERIDALVRRIRRVQDQNVELAQAQNIVQGQPGSGRTGGNQQNENAGESTNPVDEALGEINAEIARLIEENAALKTPQPLMWIQPATRIMLRSTRDITLRDVAYDEEGQPVAPETPALPDGGLAGGLPAPGGNAGGSGTSLEEIEEQEQAEAEETRRREEQARRDRTWTDSIQRERQGAPPPGPGQVPGTPEPRGSGNTWDPELEDERI